MEGVVILLIMLGLYFAPAIIASTNDHNNAAGIWVLNIFLGWTLIGWVIALVWAISNPPAQRTVVVPVAPQPAPAQTTTGDQALSSDEFWTRTNDLKALLDKGALTEAEYEAKRAELLKRLAI